MSCPIEGGIIYRFGLSVSCAQRLRAAHPPDRSYADVGKGWVSADDLPVFKTLSSVAKKGAPRERGSVFRRNVERENRIRGTIDNCEASSAMAPVM